MKHFFSMIFFFQAIIQVRQLKEYWHKERERHDQYMKLSNEKLEKEREKIREANQVERNNLNKQVNCSNSQELISLVLC